jgi:hypothetical protein
MVGALLIGAAGVTALAAAASLRLQSLVSAALVGYLAFAANLGAVTWALSPFRAVTRPGLAAAESVLLAASLAVWWRRGRPGLPLAAARPAARQIVADPVCAVFLAAVAALLAYELVLGLTAPANNWDSLTYHLSRVAAWVSHGGVYRIPDAPTARMNEYQPFAEQQILFFFVAAGSGALYALPEYVAQVAILVAVYGASRRLGFTPRAAACASFLLATFSLVALQASTAQNDLVAASFPAAAACLLLGTGRLEPALAGVAVGMGLGAKLTTSLVLPVLAVLALVRGRRQTALAVAGAAAGFVAVGMWGFVINLANTGHLLGYLGTTIYTPAYERPLHPSAVATSMDVLYETFDLAVLSDRLIRGLWIAGAVAAVATAAWLVVRGGSRRRAAVAAVSVAVPFVSPLLVIHGSDLVAWLTREWGFPVRGHGGNVGVLNRAIPEAAFGALGAVLFLGVPLVTAVAFALRRADVRQLSLAASVPLFYVLLGHETFNYFMTRFLIVPAALVAPLFARLFASRLTAACYLAVASVAVGLVVTQDPLRPLDGRDGFGRPWQLTQAQAAALTDERGVGDAVAAYDRLVPPRACAGAVLGANEPAYLLSGPALRHKVVYLPVERALPEAYRHLLSYVVISTSDNRWAAGTFRSAGWSIRSLGGYWLLAVAPHAGDGECAGRTIAFPG